MSHKKDPEIKSIIDGFQMLGSETGGLINPNELKEIMEIMNMKEKNPFLYNIIEKFCSDPKVEQKGGIEAEDFISQIDDELNDTSSMEGLYNLFTVFFNPITNKIPITTFSQIAKSIDDIEGEEKIKYLINKAQLGDKELNYNEFNEIIPLESPKRQNEKMIYKKKSSKMNGRESFHKINKNNNVYNKVNNKVNNKANNCVVKNYDEMSAENLNDSMKNDEITFNVNKYNNQIENEMEYDKINVDVSNFDNDKNNYQNNYQNTYEITEEPKEEIPKKKYRHVRKTQSTNYEEEFERNRNDVNNNEYEMKENGKDLKEKDEMPKAGRYRYARSKGEIKGNKDKVKEREVDDIEENEDLNEKKDFNYEEKSDVKASKRYHRRYREAKSNTPDRNEKINNDTEN